MASFRLCQLIIYGSYFLISIIDECLKCPQRIEETHLKLAKKENKTERTKQIKAKEYARFNDDLQFNFKFSRL